MGCPAAGQRVNCRGPVSRLRNADQKCRAFSSAFRRQNAISEPAVVLDRICGTPHSDDAAPEIGGGGGSGPNRRHVYARRGPDPIIDGTFVPALDLRLRNKLKLLCRRDQQNANVGRVCQRTSLWRHVGRRDGHVWRQRQHVDPTSVERRTNRLWCTRDVFG